MNNNLPPNTHFKFPCVVVPQGPRVTLYVGALSFVKIWSICTVSPRQPREDDPLYSSELKPAEQGPQRAAKDERLREIADFVEERLTPGSRQRKEAIFPSSIILGLLTNIEMQENATDSPNASSAMIRTTTEGELAEVWLPKIPQSLFIIDGQHRLKGLRYLEERLEDEVQQLEKLGADATAEQLNCLKSKSELLKHLRNLKVPISLLVDFDLAEQAMVFATVNFNQKTVSRSFYYDIFGTFESEQVTPISFTHDLVLHLNNSDKSPLKDMIKLLGTGPGLVSQAFLAARLTLLIDPGCPKAVFRDYLLRRRVEDIEASRQLAAIIRSFFRAVKNQLSYAWPTRFENRYSSFHYQFILCKSMSISGLLASLGDLYRISVLDFAFGSEPQVAGAETFSDLFFEKFLTKFDPEGRKPPLKSVFARGQPWSIGGSTIVEKRIYEQMRSWMFDAYVEAINDSTSAYSLAIDRFRLDGRARSLCIDNPKIKAPEFWLQTERIWLKLAGQIRPPVAD